MNLLAVGICGKIDIRSCDSVVRKLSVVVIFYFVNIPRHSGQSIRIAGYLMFTQSKIRKQNYLSTYSRYKFGSGS